MTRGLSQVGSSAGQRDLQLKSELGIAAHTWEPALRKWRQGGEVSLGHTENQRKKKGKRERKRRRGSLKSTKPVCTGITHPSIVTFKPPRV